MRKIMQNLFKSLWYCSVDRCYIVLNDMNFEKKVYADSDEEAIKELGWQDVQQRVQIHLRKMRPGNRLNAASRSQARQNSGAEQNSDKAAEKGKEQCILEKQLTVGT